MFDLLATGLLASAQPKQPIPVCNARAMLQILQVEERPIGLNPTRIDQCADYHGYAIVRYRAIWQRRETSRYATFQNRGGRWDWRGSSPYRYGILDNFPRWAADYLEQQIR